MKTKLLTIFLIAAAVEARSRKREQQPSSALDRYISEAQPAALNEGAMATAPGSLYGTGRLADLVRDQRAYQVHDIVTVLVSDSASALARGATSTSRKSSASGGITALAGPIGAATALPNLGALGGDSKLDGQGQTSRLTQISTTLSARVAHVLPNGYLVLEGVKNVAVNSERQMVTVRGVCRPQDLGPGNTIRSERLAQLEIQVNGKGVVGDAVRRPWILYRILTGLLPF